MTVLEPLTALTPVFAIAGPSKLELCTAPEFTVDTRLAVNFLFEPVVVSSSFVGCEGHTYTISVGLDERHMASFAATYTHAVLTQVTSNGGSGTYSLVINIGR
jgi:hypothetical protein